MNVLLSQNLLKHLERLATKSAPCPRAHGILYGLETSAEIVLLMCAFFEDTILTDSVALQAFLEQNHQTLPTGLDPVGVVVLSNLSQSPNNHAGFVEALRTLFTLHPKRQDLVLLSVAQKNLSGSDDDHSASLVTTGQRLERTNVSPTSLVDVPVAVKTNEWLQRCYSCFHLNAQLDSALTPIHSKHGALKALELKLLELQVENKEDFAYGLQENSLFLLPSIPSLVVPAAGFVAGSMHAQTRIPDCLSILAKKRDKAAAKVEGAKRLPFLLSDATAGVLPNEPIALKLFYNASNGKSQHGSSPLLTIGQGSTHLIRFCLDTYLFLSNETSLAELVEAADLAKKRRLAGMVDFLRQSTAAKLKSDEISGLPIPYNIVNGPNLLTLYVGANGDYDSSFDELYDRFGYDRSAPVLRKEASLRSLQLLSRKNLLNVGDRLIAQHSKFLSESSSWDQFGVQGAYTYHHYKQDRFDDDGWGCAYRSLQTLYSWFKLQGFTDTPIPNHEQIQRLLVEIKDREKSLIGSRQWIGATEIARALEHLLQVQCRIVFVPSGRDLGPAFAALKTHFETEGTPVMIGGGVYAYTIGGVAVNRTTGEVKALVIDPHYVGDDDLDLVLKKNGVAWKTPDFWDQNAFFNLCCPLRPKL
ncbi:Ufm1-specific protease 2 [Hypsibius exemplaris]|uniref:Ufm1-specific protease 2 n=1 Tax=Hypsibius exemplaris TaxID=2072580 RepID=A0A1W0W9N2_HYPEX|nr:Ufm1-specific protease 2 [Hypsibius exemplaris]